MHSVVTPHDFVTKWKESSRRERGDSQSHFIDLCRLNGVGSPSDEDPTGTWYTFEKQVKKRDGRTGFADVWRKECFAWEYKGKGRNLDTAYEQLQEYREGLENPPLMVVSDMEVIRVYTNFNNSPTVHFDFTLDHIAEPKYLARLRALWQDPEEFRSPHTKKQVTEEAALEFAKLAQVLRDRLVPSAEAAHFLIQILFCLFAEDVDLLPNHVFTTIVSTAFKEPQYFVPMLEDLFVAMSKGGRFGAEKIPYFNGGLFENIKVFRLPPEAINTLRYLTTLDWSQIEPAIFGTLFERSLDPNNRTQLGAHYTSKEDILLIVEPVLMMPLRRDWEQVRAKVVKLIEAREAESLRSQRSKFNDRVTALLVEFTQKLATIRVLDPACGSGNFLYVALRQLLDLEWEVSKFAARSGLTYIQSMVSPEQLFGIEVNEYARELAQATIWIGYIQWLRERGLGNPTPPILQSLQTISRMDALIALGENDHLYEPDWPSADVIVGNPPFLGGNRVRKELGDRYVNNLFSLYSDRIPPSADLVTYWFERTRAYIEEGKVKRAGLLATNSIRGGSNRKVLERIKQTGEIFMAWSNRDWALEGAAVRVSMIGFDNGGEEERVLDGRSVTKINPDLTSSINITIAQPLPENAGICFRSDEKGGPFEIDNKTAQKMLRAVGNPNGRPNSDVIRPWVNGLDVTRRPRNMWIIDFGLNTTIEEASMYELPFQHVEQQVKPTRQDNNNPYFRDYWWLHRIPAVDMRKATAALPRFLVTVRHSKHRVFCWLSHPTLPDSALYTFARDDDYFFGVLHSKVHEIWALRMGTSLEDRPRYTPTTTFETFPFPLVLGEEFSDNPLVHNIAITARELDERRNRWLYPEGASETEITKRTLTNLYNAKPTWLVQAHKHLDRAVMAAYGWEPDLTDDQILERLLALNLQRAADQ